MYCGHCGTKIEAEDLYCPACGSPLQVFSNLKKCKEKLKLLGVSMETKRN